MLLYDEQGHTSSTEDQIMATKTAEVSVSAVKRTMAVLELLSDGSSYSVTEIAGIIGFHKSTVFRFLTTLVSLGYVSQDTQSERYSLTDKLVTSLLSHPLKPSLIHAATAVMEDLAARTEETIHLALLEGSHITYIHKIESTRTLRVAAMSSSIGSEAPLYCTSLGKVMLSHQDSESVDRYLAQTDLSAHTEKTITEKKDFLEELRNIREQGFSIDDEENEIGVRCIGAPIFDRQGEAVGAVSISAPAVRMDEARVEELSVMIRHSGDEISRKLGHTKR